MRITAGFLVLACSVVGTGVAQTKQSAEIGTSFGVTVLSRSGASSLTAIGIPAGVGAAVQPSIYATIFATPSVMVEPQVSFSRLSSGGSAVTTLDLGAQVGYLITPAERNSAYVAANGAFQSLSDGTSFSGFGVGGALGYRMRVGSGFAVRLEARYRHWLGDFDGINEVGFGVGLGGII